MREKSIYHHFSCCHNTDQINRFSQSTFENWLPKEPNHTLGLADELQPCLSRFILDTAIFLNMCASLFPVVSRQPQQPQRKGRFFTKRKMPHAKEQRSQMQGRRQPHRGSACRWNTVVPNKIEGAVASQRAGYTSLFTKVKKVGAATHGNVLTGIDEPASERILKRRRTTADAPACLEHNHLVPHLYEPCFHKGCCG